MDLTITIREELDKLNQLRKDLKAETCIPGVGGEYVEYETRDPSQTVYTIKTKWVPNEDRFVPNLVKRDLAKSELENMSENSLFCAVKYIARNYCGKETEEDELEKWMKKINSDLNSVRFIETEEGTKEEIDYDKRKIAAQDLVYLYVNSKYEPLKDLIKQNIEFNEYHVVYPILEMAIDPKERRYHAYRR